MAATLTGQAFRVNTSTASDQESPSITPLASGDYVIAWSTGGQNDPENGIFAQRYTQAGTAIGSQFRIDQPVAHRYVGLPVVAPLKDGGFIVTWGAHSTAGEGGFVMMRRFDANGTPGYARQDPYSNPGNWSVLGLPDGGFVRVVTPYDLAIPGYKLILQRLRVDNTEAGPPVEVSPGGTLWNLTPLKDGNLLVTWARDDNASRTLWMQRLTPDGVLIGTPAEITDVAGVQDDVSTTVLADGGFAMAWTRYDGRRSMNVVRLFAPDGAPRGPAQVVDGEQDLPPPPCYVDPRTGETRCPGSPIQFAPSVSALADGGYLLSWRSGTRAPGVFAQRFAGNGTAVGPRTVVADTGTPYNGRTAIAAVAGGGFVTAWMADDGSQNGIFARQSGPDGMKEGSAP